MLDPKTAGNLLEKARRIRDLLQVEPKPPDLDGAFRELCHAIDEIDGARVPAVTEQEGRGLPAQPSANATNPETGREGVPVVAEEPVKSSLREGMREQLNPPPEKLPPPPPSSGLPAVPSNDPPDDPPTVSDVPGKGPDTVN